MISTPDRTDGPANAASRTLRRTWPVILLLLVVATIGWFMRIQRVDDAYITYRYSQNLAGGRGFVFNPGETVLGTTAPLHGLLLALAARLGLSDLPCVAIVLGFAAAFCAALCIGLTLAGAGNPSAGLYAALLVAISPWTYYFAPLETTLLAALSWAAICFHTRNRPWAATLAGALATLMRPDAALLLVIIWGLRWLRERSLSEVLEHAALALLVTAPWLIYASAIFGSPLPNTLAAKSGWGGDSLQTFVAALWPQILAVAYGAPWLSAVLAGLALVGLAACTRARRYRTLAVVPIWLALYTLAYSLLRIPFPYTWYYYPLICGLAFFAGLGLDRLISAGLRMAQAWTQARPRAYVAARSAIAALLVLALGWQVWLGIESGLALRDNQWAGPRDRLYRDAGLWLQAHTNPQDVVAAPEVGTLAYYSDRPMLDLFGLVDPAVIPHVKEGDWDWAIRTYRPAYVLVHDRAVDSAPGPCRWLKSAYSSYKLVRTFRAEGYPYLVDLYARKS